MTARPIDNWSHDESPFHEGERALQQRAGVLEKMDRQGRRAVRPYLPEQHREFYRQLPFLLVGTVDHQGQPWASIVTGRVGFITSPDDRTLVVNARPLPGDPLEANLQVGSPVGLLGIELVTRRRNRATGTVTANDPAGFTVAIQQTFGNCPQYIQAREVMERGAAAPSAPAIQRAAALDDGARAIIRRADTLFIATAHRSQDPTDQRRSGADVSHRGGNPGFVRIDDDRTLTLPDFVGNFHFNTFGNLALDPRAGLLWVDFNSGDLLHLAGKGEVIWEGEELKAFAGAERLLRFHIEQVIRVAEVLPLRFSEPEFSPILARTGSWERAAQTLQAAKDRNRHRPLRLVEAVDESAEIRSLYLEAADGGGLAPYQPGQFLPIQLQGPGGEAIKRTYTLSDAPNGRYYRLSVKREAKGVASNILHRLMPGDTLEAMAPRGGFVFEEGNDRPVVMISAGVGITPVVAMLNSLLVNEGRSRHHRPIYFIHGARNGAVQAFGEALRHKAALHGNLTLHVRYSQPGPEDELGRTHHSEGYIDKGLLQQLLPLDDYDVYLCGPQGFMQAVYDTLGELGVRDERIRFEAFGPASVKRRRLPATPGGEPAVVPPGASLEADEAVEVVFARSNKTARWRPADGTLLELAEAQGLEPAYSCRSGMCGTCAVKVTAGAVDYTETPTADKGHDEALICCAVPRPGPHLEDSLDRVGVTLDL
ncbi:MAG: pyridoxamine 5'-phosphate oxidase family protein [Candidatus Competibacterales bacterium]